MNERKYSLTEIDDMREALRLWRMLDPGFPGQTEDVLRTYMLNGSAPEEVIAHAKAREAEAFKEREEWDAECKAVAEQRDRERGR